MTTYMHRNEQKKTLEHVFKGMRAEGLLAISITQVNEANIASSKVALTFIKYSLRPKILILDLSRYRCIKSILVLDTSISRQI